MKEINRHYLDVENEIILGEFSVAVCQTLHLTNVIARQLRHKWKIETFGYNMNKKKSKIRLMLQ